MGLMVTQLWTRQMCCMGRLGANWVACKGQGLVCGRVFCVCPLTLLTWLGWNCRRRSSIQRSLSALERQEKQRLPPAQVTYWVQE